MKTLKSTVLIVEDNFSVASILARHLRDANFAVHQAGNLKGARTLLRQHTIDVTCLDIKLPDGNGLEICSDLKNTRTKTIVLSNLTDLESRKYCFESGANDYLPKPFYPEELVLRVKNLMQGKNKSQILTHSNYSLYTNKKTLCYEEKVCLVTNTEFYFLYYLMKYPHSKDREDMKDFLKEKLGKRVTDYNLNTIASRLKKKLLQTISREVFKSSYGQGYYIPFI